MALEAAIASVKENAHAASGQAPGAGKTGRPRVASAETDTVELIITFLIDPRKSDQIVRGVAVLPNGTGKSVRVAVFASGAAAEAARRLGVEVLGDEDLITRIISSGGEAINFDRLVATPDFARPLAKAGRILGPRGLMPNPKMGTLTEDITEAVRLMRTGRIEFRVGRDRQLQLSVGKVAFSQPALQENVVALLDSLVAVRPKVLPGSGLDGYIGSIYLKSSHTPVVPVDPKLCEALLTHARDDSVVVAPDATPDAPQQPERAGADARGGAPPVG